MIIAKTEFAYHHLQKEFLNHRVQKKYVAIVCGKDKESCNRILKEAESGRGYISLPLMADFLTPSTPDCKPRTGQGSHY